MSTTTKKRVTILSQTEILDAIQVAMVECDIEKLWRWGQLPLAYDVRCLDPSDLLAGSPAWSAIATLDGFWLAPGSDRKDVPQIVLLRDTLQGLSEISAKIFAEPITCTIRISGKEEPFFGETWTLTFPDLPIIKDNLPSDHPLKGLDDRFMRNDDPTTLAILASQRAHELRTRTTAGGWTSVDSILDELYAEQAEAEAARLVAIDDQRIIEGAGEKLVPVDDADLSLADTLEDPNMISVGAASERLQLARGVGVLKSAVDAAVTVGAKDSLTKSLTHQLAAAHRGAMKMMQQGFQHGVPVPEATRCVTAAARLMTVYQGGMLTMQKLRNGNKQTFVIKHINVQQVKVEGGQAVVNGSAGDASQKGSRK